MSGSGGPGSAQQRISRLERSIGWLQEQQAAMVTALHREIETLKNRNRGTHMFRKCYEIKDVLSNKKCTTAKNRKNKCRMNQEEVNSEMLMIRAWNRQLKTCRQHNSDSRKQLLQ